MKTSKIGSENRWQSRRLLVENKLSFTGPDSELSIYDTYRAALGIGLRAGPLTYCGMITGKKIMHDFTEENDAGRLFLPHESYVMPPGGYVDIDFPDAKETKPTTCLTIEISKERIGTISERMRDLTALDTLEHDWEYQTQIIHNQHTADTQNLLERLVSLFTQNHPDKEIMVELGISELIVKLLRHQARDVLLRYCNKQPGANGVTSALYCLEKNFTLPLDIDQLSKHACMSRSRLYVEFKKQLGCTPGEYLQQLRLKYASNAILKGKSITEACYETGFNDLSHFSRRFTKFFGRSPRQFQVDNQDKILHKLA